MTAGTATHTGARFGAPVHFTPEELRLLAEADRVRGLAVTDKRYRATPLGLVVGQYIRWKRNEWGATPRTIEDYEAVLAALCLRYPDLELVDWEKDAGGTERLREFIDQRWGHLSSGTRRKITSIFRDFFRYCVDDRGILKGDPARVIRRPKRRDVHRDLFTPQERALLCHAAPHPSADRCGVELLFGLAIRRGGLRQIQLGDYVSETGLIKITTKGGTKQTLPVSDPYLKAILDEYWSSRVLLDRWREEYLIHPTRTIPSPYSKVGTPWEDRFRPLGDQGMDAWWHRRTAAAGVPHRGMHSCRHTRLTEIVRSGKGGLKLAQLVAGHKSIQTTGDIYANLDIGDMAEMFRDLSADRDASADV